jgi:hypothetical protein
MKIWGIRTEAGVLTPIFFRHEHDAKNYRDFFGRGTDQIEELRLYDDFFQYRDWLTSGKDPV